MTEYDEKAYTEVLHLCFQLIYLRRGGFQEDISKLSFMIFQLSWLDRQTDRQIDLLRSLLGGLYVGFGGVDTGYWIVVGFFVLW
jgi:hypothetical protein